MDSALVLLDDPLSRIREICLAFPEASERLSHGEPAWFIREKKQFASYANNHHDDRVGVWFAAAEGVQEELIHTAPDRYFRPPYVGHRGWVAAYVDVPVDCVELEGLLEDAYRCVAEKRR